MALALHVTGPGLDMARVLHPGEPELVLGRDIDCSIHLPDPQRNVSRRHLAVRVEGDALRFLVLSEVNGAETDGVEVPPGGQGVLQAGQSLRIGDYIVAVSASDQPPPPPADPWEVLGREFSAPVAAPAGPPEDDPFGDWGFGTTFGDGTPQGALEAAKLVPGDIGAFFDGLGLDSDRFGKLSRGELETIGRMVRIALVGLLRLQAAGAGAKHEMRVEERTLLAVRDNNPLKTDWPHQTMLEYLFGGRAASVGFVGPDRAMRQLIDDLLAHERASAVAARVTVERTLHEFDPEALKDFLVGGRGGLFGSGRAWEAYSRYYGDQGADLAQWAQRQLDRYFADAYLQEVQRLKRETSPR